MQVKNAGDGQVYYEYDEFDYIDDSFTAIVGQSSANFYEAYDEDTVLDWNSGSGGDVELSAFGTTDRMAEASLKVGGSDFYWKPIFGDLIFDYSTDPKIGGYARLEVEITDGSSTNTEGPYSSASDTVTLPLDDYDMSSSQFNITFRFEASGRIGQTSTATLERVRIRTPEFLFQEVSGDSAEYDENKYVLLHIVPEQTSFDQATSSVRLDYGDSSVLTTAPYSVTALSRTGSAGNYNYTIVIPPTNTYTGDEIYHKPKYRYGIQWENCSNQGQFGVVDTQAPDIIGAAGNNDNIDYNETKYLDFTITETNPSYHPAGLDLTSLQLEVALDAGFSTNKITLGDDFFNSTGGDGYRVPVNHSIYPYYKYDNLIHYRLSVDDQSSNTGQESGSFTIEDNFAPAFVSLDGNYTDAIEYTDVVNMTVSVTDWAPQAARLERVLLFIRNGSAPTFSNGLPTLDTKVVLNGSQVYNEYETEVEFLINSTCLSAKYDLYYEFWMIDREGNARQGLAGSIDIGDSIGPNIIFSEIAEVTNLDGDMNIGVISYDEDVFVKFYITEPQNGIGFPVSYTAGDLRLFFKNSTVGPTHIDDADNLATPIQPYEWFQYAGVGGEIRFRIPQENFTTGDRIWVWIRAQDANDNQNNSYGDLHDFYVYDKNAPRFQNFDPQDVNYYQNQNLQFRLYKGPEGSDIRNFTIFINRDSGASPTQYIQYYSFNSTNWTVPYVTEIDENRTVDVLVTILGGESELNFKYNEIYYLFIQAYDTEYNQRNITDNFRIRDARAPLATPSASNAYGALYTDGKTVSVTVEDPDYGTGRGSGIGTVELYYRINSDTVSTTDSLIPLTVTDAAGGTLSSAIPTTGYPQVVEKISLMFIVKDKDSGTISTTVQTFYLNSTAWMGPSSPAGLVANEPFYTNQGEFSFSVQLSAPFQLWYSVDGGSISQLSFEQAWNQAISYSFTEEKTYVFRVYYYKQDQDHVQIFSIVYDKTPPQAIRNLAFAIEGNALKLTWDAPGEASGTTIRYEVYKSTSPDTLGDCVAGCETTLLTTVFEDFDYSTGGQYYYTVIAIDPAGNRSQMTQLSVSIPMPTWIWMVVIGGVVAAAIGIVIKVRGGRERAVLAKAFAKQTETADVGLDEEDIGEFVKAARVRKQEGMAAKPADDSAKWASITMGHAAKARATTKKLAQGQYWKQENGILANQALTCEKKGDLQGAIRRYELILRSAQRTKDTEVQILAQQKISQLYEQAYHH